jgi:hypothetical protein
MLVKPILNLLARLVFSQAVSLLNQAFELISATSDLVQVVIREIAPFFFDFAFQLLPISFDSIPVHRCCPYV